MKIILLLSVSLCLLLTSCSHMSQSNPGTTAEPPSSGASLPKESASKSSEESYIDAYTDFIGNIDHYESISDNEFPVTGYCLMDFNFDHIPELLVDHDSGGSAGGYYSAYYFDGTGVTAIRDDQNEPERFSNYSQVLADKEHKIVYLLKEMYLLKGNENGTYGYIREVKDLSGIPCVHDILKLDVNQDMDLNQYSGTYNGEDDYLSDASVSACLITQHYSGDKWIRIPPSAYLKLKRELIPEKNSYVDLMNTGAYFSVSGDDASSMTGNIKLTPEEINTLFSKWLNPDL